MLDRTRLLSALASHRWVLEPGVAVVLFVIWLFSRPANTSSALALLFSCAAVALSRVLPAVALGVVWLAVSLQLAEPDPLLGAFRIIGALAIFFTVFGVVAHSGRALRWSAFASACLLGPPMAYLFTVKGELKFAHFGPVIGGFYASQGVGLLLMSLLMIVAFLIGWVLGFLVARQREFGSADALGGSEGRSGSRGSVLVWLASSGGTVVAEGDTDRPRLVQRLRRGQLTFDVAGASLFAVVCLSIDAVGLFGSAPGGSRPGTIVLAVFTVAVALRRMSPALALAFAWLAAVIQMTTGNSILASDLGVLLVLYATAAYGDRVVRWVGLLSAGLGALVAALYLSVTNALAQDYFDLLSTSLTSVILQFAFLFVVSATVLGLSWVLGLLMRTWRDARFSRHAQTIAELDRNRAEEVVVVEQERTRIARDMHDVVAHSLAVVIAQADGARYARHTAPEAVDEALTTIAATARSALGDVRVLLAELRQSQHEGPQPSLDDVSQTVEHIRAAGLPVSFERLGHVEGLGSAQQIAGFRIVQEALTNALRHGDTSHPATVVLAAATEDAGGPGIVISVRNTMKHQPADGSPTGSVPRIGHGLPGMRERASLAGGHALRRSGRRCLRGLGVSSGRERGMTGVPSGAIRVLLVDDQALFRAGVRMLVGSQPDLAFVGEAADGQEGVELARRVRPDVVLMDIRMPIMDGIAATGAIIVDAERDGRTPPRIVVLTTFDLDEAAARAIRAGASGFVLKDAEPEFLLAAIRTVHAGSAVIAAGATRELFQYFSSGRVERPEPAEFCSLTAREREIFVRAARGLSNAEIAGSEFLSEATVKTHISRILSKLGLRDRVQMVVYAFEHGLTEGAAD